jgi:hypothetical protein
MKKALEAGIKHCSLFEKYFTHLPEMVDFYYKQKIILQVMLAALDDEPEKPEPQGGVVDHTINVRGEQDAVEAFNKFIRKWCGSNYPHLIDSDQNDGEFVREKIQWLKTKPAIDPEIKRVYDHWKKNDGIVVIERAFERDMWNCIKAHVENGGV